MGQAFDEDGRSRCVIRCWCTAHRVLGEANPVEFAPVGAGPVGSTMSAAVRSVWGTPESPAEQGTPESPAEQVETEATAIRRYVETIVRAMEANGRTPARVWVESLRAAIR